MNADETSEDLCARLEHSEYYVDAIDDAVLKLSELDSERKAFEALKERIRRHRAQSDCSACNQFLDSLLTP